MSCDADGTDHDYFGGADDLRAGRVRFVGDARTRIEEDALRLLRFFRFQARYGRVLPEPALLATISGCLGMIDRLSAERIWSELRRILAGPEPIPTLALMGRTGMLAACLPALSGRETAALSLLRLLPAEETGDPLLRLAALMAGAGLDPASVETTLTRLRVSRVEDRTVRAYLEPLPRSLASTSLASDAPTVRRLLSATGRQILTGRTWLEQARSPQGADWPALRGLIADLPVPVFPLAGRDLLQAGHPPGPRLGEILAATRAWWEQNGCDPDRDGCMAFARSLWTPSSLS
jgi:poly(A) polymerase